MRTEYIVDDGMVMMLCPDRDCGADVGAHGFWVELEEDEVDDRATIITLSGGETAVVDAEDAEWLSGHRWYLSNTGYAVRDEHKNGAKRSVLMHRVVLGLERGGVADHINRNKLDNRKANLRLADHSRNGANRSKVHRKNGTSSAFKGVSLDRRSFHWREKVWEAYIWVDRKKSRLGRHRSEVSAARAYDEAALKYYGTFACLNFGGHTVSALPEDAPCPACGLQGEPVEREVA